MKVADAALAPKASPLIIAARRTAILAVGRLVLFPPSGEEVHAEAPPPKPPYSSKPDTMVNLRGAGERVQYLKVRVVLELKDERFVEAIKPTMPRVTDVFQTYLRELRPGDLSGSAGLFRLKEELTKRVNVAVAPNAVTAVLFKEIVVQ